MQLYIYIYIFILTRQSICVPPIRNRFTMSFYIYFLFSHFFFPDINETDSYSPYAVHFIRTGDLDCGILSPGNVETYLGNETINTTYKLQ